MITGDAAPDHEVITISGIHVSLGSDCPAVRGKFTLVKSGLHGS